MTTLTTEEAFDVYLDAPIFGPKRRPEDPEDFGDAGTYGLCVKRRGVSVTDSDIDTDYGRYMGPLPAGGFAVGFFSIDGRPIGGEVFPTFEELKAVWTLD
jgi:hypothetical protein